jgi:iron complex transport system permease protein
MQTILNNPLASPFTLGVSSAASFGAALAIVLGLGIPGIADKWFIPANAFVFALLACFILDGISRWTRWRPPAWCCLASRWCLPLTP